MTHLLIARVYKQQSSIILFLLLLSIESVASINVRSYLNLVDLESKSVIVKSDNVFFSQRFDNNCSEISAGKKASGCLKLSLVAELDDPSLGDLAIVEPKIFLLLQFTKELICSSKSYMLYNGSITMLE